MTDVELMRDPAQRAAFFPRYGSGVRWSFPAAARTQVKLIDPQTGAEINEPGIPGVLRLRGPSVFAGYLDGTRPFDEDGYLITGDVFAIDGPTAAVPALRRPDGRPDHPWWREHRAGRAGDADRVAIPTSQR